MAKREPKQSKGRKKLNNQNIGQRAENSWQILVFFRLFGSLLEEQAACRWMDGRLRDRYFSSFLCNGM